MNPETVQNVQCNKKVQASVVQIKRRKQSRLNSHMQVLPDKVPEIMSYSRKKNDKGVLNNLEVVIFSPLSAVKYTILAYSAFAKTHFYTTNKASLDSLACYQISHTVSDGSLLPSFAITKQQLNQPRLTYHVEAKYQENLSSLISCWMHMTYTEYFPLIVWLQVLYGGTSI